MDACGISSGGHARSEKIVGISGIDCIISSYLRT